MTTSYPPALRVRGFPFHLQGWNNIYVLEAPTKEGDSPRYCLQPYTLYGLVPILPTTIEKVGDKWIIYRQCDGKYVPICKKYATDQSTPIGDWGDITVGENVAISEITISMKQLTVIAALALVAIYTFMR